MQKIYLDFKTLQMYKTKMDIKSWYLLKITFKWQ